MEEDIVRGFISIKIKELRESMGWKKGKLAQRLNVAPSMITSWEQGIRIPSIEHVYAMAQLFGVGVDVFFPSVIPETEKELEDELISDFRKLNPEGRTIALATMKGFSHMAKFRSDLFG